MDSSSKVENVKISEIRILNPRKRSRQKAQELMESIDRAGLKRPITVSRTRSASGAVQYDLVCGQGRLEAVKELGWETVPAMVIEVPEEDRYLMSLAENMARVRRSGVDRLRQIAEMEKRGMSTEEIVKSTGLAGAYISGILNLLKSGADDLVRSVDQGTLPLSVAVQIARSDDQAVQMALQEAYDSGQLSRKALARAQRIIKQKTDPADSRSSGDVKPAANRVKTADEIVKAYKDEAERQTRLIRKNRVCETRLRIIVTALRQMFADEHFTTLLKAEGLDTYPRNLADLVQTT